LAVSVRPEDERSRPASNEAATKQVDQDRVATVTDRRVLADSSRRSRRWARHQLDGLLGIPLPPIGEVDYDAMGFTLGMPERRAAGLAILERERAA
jgi:hypothetical protein